MSRTLTWLAGWLLIAAVATAARGVEPDGAAETTAAETTAAEATAAETTAAEVAEAQPTPPTFRLFARRDTSLRLRPNAGVRVPPLAPLFSPHTADFDGRERATGALYALFLSISAWSADGERESFKGQEFRDLSENFALGLDAQLRSDGDRLRVTGRHLLLDDHDVDLEWRRVGVSKARLHVNRIPHNFAFDAPSLYAGIGSGELTVADATRQTLAGSMSLVDAAERARALVAAAPLADLRLTRDRLGLELELTVFDPLSVKITVDDESRRGVRPWSGSFGFSNFVEIPWPVNYDTTNLEAELEYARGSTLVRGSYGHSSFDNNIGSVAFDNPWRITDSSLPGSIVSSFESGPTSGLIDLYPSNEQDELSLTAVKSQLPADGTLLATVAWSRMEQDDPLLAYTTNTAIVPGLPATRPSTLPTPPIFRLLSPTPGSRAA